VGGRLRPAPDRHEIRNFRSGSIVLKKIGKNVQRCLGTEAHSDRWTSYSGEGRRRLVHGNGERRGETQVRARDQCSDIRNGRLREARWEVVARVAYCFKRASISPRRVNRRNLSQFTSSVYFAGLLLPKFGGNSHELAWENLRV